MKKKVIAAMMGLCTMAVVAGCGSKEISNDKIKISQYKGIEVEAVEAAEVTDADVEDSINSTLQAQSTQNDITDRPAQEGDIVTINYEGKLDGVAFDGGTAENQQLTIGEASYIDGFEDGIIGHSVGETFDLNLTFPDPYTGNPDLAGKPVVFTITLNNISELVLPELTDEFVAGVSEESKTIEEYKKEVKADLEESNKLSKEAQEKQNMWTVLMEKCTVKKYPEDEKQEVVDNLEAQYGTLAAGYGMTSADEFVEQVYGIKIEEMAENMIKQEYAIELIAEKEKLEVSDKEYEEGLKKYAEQYGYTDTEEFEEAIGKDQVERVLLQDKVAEWLMDNCKLTEKKSE